jgi:hypothetical protein
LDLAARDEKSLILLSEEHVSRVRARAERMMTGRTKVDVARCLKNLALLATPNDPAHLPTYVARHVVATDAAHAGVKFVVLDSIQGTTGAGGSDARACRAALDAARLLQSAGIATLLVGHVTKQNAIRGPRTLEHAVDVVLHLNRRGGRRTLTVSKNRFGPAVLQPVPLAIDPATTRLMPARPAGGAAGRHVATARAWLPHVGGVEVQTAAALAPPSGRAAGRLLACRGIARAEVQYALHCLGSLPGMAAVAGELDLSIACRPLSDRDDPLLGARSSSGGYASLLHVPLCLSIAAATLCRTVPSDLVAIGEVDLAGRVRSLPGAAITAATAAMRAGELAAMRLLVPADDRRFLPWNCGCELSGVETVADAVAWVWPDLDAAGIALLIGT